MTRSFRLLWLLLWLQCFVFAGLARAATWYVRPDGGTRYSVNTPKGQCDGTADKAYPGSGVNQHCAFSEPRYFYSDASFSYGPEGGPAAKTFPGWGWIGQGGDTYLIRGALREGVSYRIGWRNNTKACDKDGCWGPAGDQFAAGMPAPPSGTPGHPTRLLGENYANCSAVGARTQLHGGWQVWTVLNLSGASNVEVQCLDLTDYSACGKSTQTVKCDGQDYATTGLVLNNQTTHVRIDNVRLHGLATFGIYGPTGDDVELHHVDMLGNASGGWNADDGKTGTGRLLVQNYSILWNGCAEEYPIRHAVPYGDCTDQDHGGYGDGFGTATLASNPGWQIHFDQGEVAYNTQDGIDALHVNGPGSSMTVTRTLAYGNMGQQIKVGGAEGIVQNNLIVGNCRAMQEDIPGTPPGMHAKLGLYCRAGDDAVAMTVSHNMLTRFENNTVYAAGNIGLSIECDNTKGPCDRTASFSYRNNIFIGFTNGPAHGDRDGDDRLPTPVYIDNEDNPAFQDPFKHPGSSFANNITYHPRPDAPCPLRFETHGVCGSPGLVDQTWHRYGYGNMAPASARSAAVGSGVRIDDITVDEAGHPRPSNPSRGALEFSGTTASVQDEPLPPGAALPPVLRPASVLHFGVAHLRPVLLAAALAITGVGGWAIGRATAPGRPTPPPPPDTQA